MHNVEPGSKLEVLASALAVLRLITSANLVGWCTGRSVGSAPLSMGATYWTSTGRPTAFGHLLLPKRTK